ncbi:MAG: hypothetical protein KC503_15910 [Myxococcales bacterium]|nr:hypothetical protein [Myxococcales bacterium]
MHICSALLACVLLSSSGCSAIFTSDRPPGSDTATPTPDGRADDSGGDVQGPSPDTASGDGPQPDAPPSSGMVIADGNWEGRTGHVGKGTVEMFRTAGGEIELRFSADFETSAVPTPVVVLTSRDSIGSAIDASKGDLDLGALTSVSGAQTYKVPGGDGGRRYVWVFCVPFGIEISRAPLKDVP